MIKIALPQYTCERCGHTWIPRKEKPKVCPVCKRAEWDSPKKS